MLEELPVEPVLEELAPPPPEPDCGAFAFALAFVVWPWNDFAATSETAPDSTTAPAIIQRLMREASLSPASRAVTAGAAGLERPVECRFEGSTDRMIGGTGKKTLNGR